MYINAGWKDKMKVKFHGAKWDMDAKKWYIPEGLDKRDFMKWMDDHQKMTVATMYEGKLKKPSKKKLLPPSALVVEEEKTQELDEDGEPIVPEQIIKDGDGSDDDEVIFVEEKKVDHDAKLQEKINSIAKPEKIKPPSRIKADKKEQENDPDVNMEETPKTKPKKMTKAQKEQALLAASETKFNTDKKLNDTLTLQNLDYKNEITPYEIKNIDLNLKNNIFLILYQENKPNTVNYNY